VGYLSPASDPTLPLFRRKMRELGYDEGANLVIVERQAGGRPDRLMELASDLARPEIDVVVALTTAAVDAAKRALADKPVIVVTSDPVQSGVAESMSRPGGNSTGVASSFTDILGKWVELLREIAPATKHIAVIGTGSVGHRLSYQLVQELLTAESRTAIAIEMTPHAIERAFAAMLASTADAAMVLSSPIFFEQKERLVELAAEAKLPTIYENRAFVEAGGLISYGPDMAEIVGLVAAFVDRIARGARPADLPVMRPSRFELAINAKTARALGLAVPLTLLARADEVIE
jgi:putative ABC transport system substrate-binding protein